MWNAGHVDVGKSGDVPEHSRRSRVPASTEPDVTGTLEGTGHDNVGCLYEDR
jgi:hypothetical protein